MDLLQQIELGLLRGVDFVECRICDLGCFGGVAVPKSRFLSSIRNRRRRMNWNITPERLEALESMYASSKLWRTREAIPSKQRLPLSDDLTKAMNRLKQMKSIFRGTSAHRLRSLRTAILQGDGRGYRA